MSSRDDQRVDRPAVKTAELLTAWREAVRAAELAERLAATAVQAADDADQRAEASAELADLAEQAATASMRAAAQANAAAELAASLAKALREGTLGEARRTVESADEAETDARTAFHDAEARAHRD